MLRLIASEACHTLERVDHLIAAAHWQTFNILFVPLHIHSFLIHPYQIRILRKNYLLSYWTLRATIRPLVSAIQNALRLPTTFIPLVIHAEQVPFMIVPNLSVCCFVELFLKLADAH